MILVEIYVAFIKKTYDFRIERSATVEDVIEEIITVVGQKENLNLDINKDSLVLSVVSKEINLCKTLTFADYDIKQGMKLILS